MQSSKRRQRAEVFQCEDRPKECVTACDRNTTNTAQPIGQEPDMVLQHFQDLSVCLRERARHQQLLHGLIICFLKDETSSSSSDRFRRISTRTQVQRGDCKFQTQTDSASLSVVLRQSPRRQQLSITEEKKINISNPEGVLQRVTSNISPGFLISWHYVKKDKH